MTKHPKFSPTRFLARIWSKRQKWRFSVVVLVSALGGMIFGIFFLAFFAGGVIYDFEDSVQGEILPPVDAIICLAGGKGRIPVAADLWYRYWKRSQEFLA